MHGPVPKPSHLRQRRNKSATRATLPSIKEAARNKVPKLPTRREGEVWHPKVVKWWHEVWKSPMAGEYLGPDVLGGLHVLAELYQKLWMETEGSVIAKLASEIRQQEVRFGLSPIDRRRLQWEVEKGETAAEATEKRRRSRRTPAETGQDPRDVLKAIAGGAQ